MNQPTDKVTMVGLTLLGVIAVVAICAASLISLRHVDTDVSPWLVIASGAAGAIGGFLVSRSNVTPEPVVVETPALPPDPLV